MAVFWIGVVVIASVAFLWAGAAADEREDEAYFAHLRRERERAAREQAERDATIGEWT